MAASTLHSSVSGNVAALCLRPMACAPTLTHDSGFPGRASAISTARGRSAGETPEIRSVKRAAPEIVLHALDPDENFIHVPLVLWPWSVASQTVGETRAEFLARASHCFVGDDYATLSQYQLNIPQAEAGHVVQGVPLLPDPQERQAVHFHGGCPCGNALCGLPARAPTDGRCSDIL